jgi:hypothetical protein
MGRNTITDVRERVERLNSGWTEPAELSFNAWGVGQNKYQLIDQETGETFGPVCIGATEFLKVIQAFEDGRRI